MPAPFFNVENNTKNKLAEIIRVNHAGEYGAYRIYTGQIKFSKNASDKKLLNSMLEHEIEHLEFFTNELKNRSIRPTLLLNFWHNIGYIIGAVSSSISINEAMLITSGVEEVIEEHYTAQIKDLKKIHGEDSLKNNISKFMSEEVEHKNIAAIYLQDNSNFKIFKKKIVKNLCKIAIFLSKKI